MRPGRRVMRLWPVVMHDADSHAWRRAPPGHLEACATGSFMIRTAGGVRHWEGGRVDVEREGRQETRGGFWGLPKEMYVRTLYVWMVSFAVADCLIST